MLKCNFCGKEFEPTPYKKRQHSKGIAVYCSTSCATAFRYKDKLEITEELIEQIRNYFYNTELPYDEIQKLSGLSKDRFRKLVNEYNIKRDKQCVTNLKQAHMKKTMNDKYGINNAMENNQFREKIKTTKLNRYGDETYHNIEKMKQTKLEKYGNVSYNNSEQAKKTNLQNIGKTTHLLKQEVIEKRKQTSIEKYGVDNPFKSSDVHKKAVKAIQEKYGVKSTLQVPDIKEKVKQTLLEKYGVDNIMKSSRYKKKQQETMFDKYGVISGFLTKNAINSHKAGTKSKINGKFVELLKEITTKSIKQESAYERYIYDIQVGDDLVIDINPTISHNTYISYPYLLGVVQENIPVSTNYHLDRTLLANKYNLHLISIFDWDSWEKVKYMLQDKDILYARNLQLKEVSLEDTSEFLNNYHLQNTCKGQDIRIGLYKDTQLVEIMTFGKPRYNKNYKWELLRLCTHKDYKVVGGAEKLFKYFIQKYAPENIISYCDLSKFSGNVYNRLGFNQIGKVEPSKHWSKNGEHITDNLLRQRGYDQLFKTNYGKGTSNEELMLNNGWLPVYDCGQATYIWKNT